MVGGYASSSLSTAPVSILPEEARRVLVTINPVAGARSRLEVVDHMASALQQRGLEPQLVLDREELAGRATELLDRGELRAVIAAGGDGTASDVVNRTPLGTPIAVYPLGTENLLASYLKMRTNVEAFADMVAAGHTAWLDAGRANGRVFLLMAGVGFDAEVVRRLHVARNGNISRWSYAKPILGAIRNYQYPELRVRCIRDQGNCEESFTCRWLFAFNLPQYAAGLKLAPRADGADGMLDVCTFQRGGLFPGLRYAAAIACGFHEHLRECSTWRCRRLRIESDAPAPYELDGDPGGELPLDIESLPGHLRVLITPTPAAATSAAVTPAESINGTANI